MLHTIGLAPQTVRQLIHHNTAPLVYLAGKIDGLSLDDCNGWREYAQELFTPEIGVLNPLRYKELPDSGAIHSSDDTAKLFGRSDKEIVVRDRLDIRRCDAVLFNLLDAGNLSAGTQFELGFASALHKPIFVVIDKDPLNPFWNRWTRENTDMIFDNLELAVRTVKFMLV